MIRALALLLALVASPALAALSPAQLALIGATPAADTRLPVNTAFVDQAGRPYRLTGAPVPTVLLFADYTCRHICGPGVTLTAGALHDAGLRPGRDYRMIVVGMDQDGPALARKLTADQLYGLPDEARALTLLTGTPPVIAAVERALGYHAIHDAEADQWAHDPALYVFGSNGRLSALLPEAATAPAAMAQAITDARRGVAWRPLPARTADHSLAGRISAICYGLASAHGVYSAPIVMGLRIGGVLICAVLALILLAALRRRPGDAA